MDAAGDLDVLWKHRGGLRVAYRQLLAYAYERIDLRSTGSPGGQLVAQLVPEEVVNQGLYDALTDKNCPAEGEALFFLVRRKIDNRLRTIEKSPKVIPVTPIENVPAIPGTIDANVLADPEEEDPAVKLRRDDEDELNRKILEETRKRLKSPQCLEARLLALIVDEVGDKKKLCELLQIDGAKFDRLKFALKTIVTAAAADLKKKATR